MAKPEKEHEAENLRLEALRLAHTSGQQVEEVLGRAKRYEQFLKYGEESDNLFD